MNLSLRKKRNLKKINIMKMVKKNRKMVKINRKKRKRIKRRKRKKIRKRKKMILILMIKTLNQTDLFL